MCVIADVKTGRSRVEEVSEKYKGIEKVKCIM